MIPLEIIAGVGSGLLGFLFKAQANSIEALRSTMELQVKKEMAADQLANSAQKRSSPVARKVLAYMVVGTFVCGLLYGVWNPDMVVSIVGDKNPVKILWGLFSFGGGTDVTVARGFVLPPWSGWVVSIVIGYFFGTGAAKPTR